MKRMNTVIGVIVTTTLLWSGELTNVVGQFLTHTTGRVHSGIHWMAEASAEVFYKLEEALTQALPGAKSFDKQIKVLSDAQKKSIASAAGVEFHPEFDKDFTFYTGRSADKKAVGYILHHKVAGKWGPIEFVMGITPGGEIANVLIVSSEERRGRPIKERKFLDQFMKKSVKDPVKLKTDIKGISGATISSRGMTDGIRKILGVFKELYLAK